MMNTRSQFSWRTLFLAVAIVAAPNTVCLATRCDGDGDGDIDLIDWAWFQYCFTGSLGPLRAAAIVGTTAA